MLTQSWYKNVHSITLSGMKTGKFTNALHKDSSQVAHRTFTLCSTHCIESGSHKHMTQRSWLFQAKSCMRCPTTGGYPVSWQQVVTQGRGCLEGQSWERTPIPAHRCGSAAGMPPACFSKCCPAREDAWSWHCATHRFSVILKENISKTNKKI